MKTILPSTLSCCTLADVAPAMTIDLPTWTAVSARRAWTIAPYGGSATYGGDTHDLTSGFLSGGSDAQGGLLEATERVDPAGPQQLDQIGFVPCLSFTEDHAYPDATVDHWLIDWQDEAGTCFGRSLLSGPGLSSATRRSGEQIRAHSRLWPGHFRRPS